MAKERDQAVYQFRDFLKSLRDQYVDYQTIYEKQITDHLNNSKLWRNQFLYIHHIKTGRFYHKGFDHALGYDMSGLTADFLVRIIHPSDLSMYFKISKALLSFVMGNTKDLVPFDSSFNINYRVRKSDGDYISILRQSTPFIKNHRNEVEAYISLCTDISDLVDHHSVKWHIYGPKNETFDYYLRQQSSEDEELFSERELDVLKLLAASLSSVEIADKLFISINTVNTHRKNLMKKANVNKTIDLILFARDKGYL
ncbi:response regulator transcription factor [Marinoscillum sp. MHG1-6]|uniref:response regulator transcription factor n=1 Tax=Marinoscillum sp. MHG1-6 TaxID=2959627 RepID=UPI00215757FB|nr:LuxR C-terminal-related transcriptional regulator [Marinoscillum sp. MHG1-6]